MITEETDNILFKSFHSDKLPRPDQNDDSFENDESHCSEPSEKNEFSCSTPLMTQEEHRNSNLSLSNSSESPAKETDCKEVMDQCGSKVFSHSLAEFEQYEQMLVDSTNRNQVMVIS